MDVVIRQASRVRGTVALPADKAICHRAALLASVSQSAVEISPWATGDDCRRTLDVVSAFGVPVTATPDGVRVHGAGLSGWRPTRQAAPCGDSGTTMRLVCGLLAGQPFRSEVTAGPSLSQRPMRRIVEPLTRMGAEITGAAQGQEVRPPLIIHGRRPLRGITYALPVASAQVKSAILLAGLFADGPTTVIEPAMTRDHTERLLQLAGVAISREGPRIALQPPSAVKLPERLSVPADPSSAAFFAVAACLLPDSRVVIPNVGLNPTRRAAFDVLKRMGAAVQLEPRAAEDWEVRGTVTASTSRLRGTTVTPAEVPQLIDELPILMVAACAADGPTRLEGVGELQVKETDRLRSMTEGLRRLGADIAIEPAASPSAGDTPSAAGRVSPRPSATVVVRPSRLHGGTVDGFGDHRTAMSLAIAGLIASGQTRLQGAECVGKSLENFFELLGGVTLPGTVSTSR